MMPDKKAPRITFTYTKSLPPKPELWKKYIDKPFKPIKVLIYNFIILNMCFIIRWYFFQIDVQSVMVMWIMTWINS